MAKFKMSRKTRRSAGRRVKSMKMGADDLQEMVKAAVKDALEEQKAEDADGAEEDPDGGSGELADILDAAVEAVNEKRKSAKSDELDPDDVEELMDAVAEVMSDDPVEEDAKRKKGGQAPKGRQTKAAPRRPAMQRPPQRKYSSIYMTRGGEGMGAAKKKKEIPPHIQLARLVKCMDVYGRNDPERAAYYAIKRYGDEEMAREFKAMSVTSPTDGGFLIPETYADQIIELLYPKTVIVELGAQQVPLTNGNLNLPKMTAGSRATWGGEQRRITTSSPKYGNIKLSAKRLEAIVPQSRELLMLSTYSSDAMFANDLTRRMQLGLDYGGLYGTGTEFQPLGIANNKEVEAIDATKMGNTDLADTNGKITADFPVHVSSTAFAKNIDDVRAGWAMNSLLEGVFKNMKTETGAYIYREEMASGKLCGIPYKVSNQIPTVNGKTDLFFGNWSDLLIGDQMGLETYTTLDGTWTDDAGISHNAFEENLAATRALMYDDIGVRHPESFLYCKNIKVK